MSLVLGVDFGTLSVRASVFDHEAGRLSSGTAQYPLKRKKEDPDFATQGHADHLRALCVATSAALASGGIDGRSIAAVAIDTTGSSVVMVDEQLKPLDDYYLWCDHRAWREAAEITQAAHRCCLEAIDWCGGVYSSEWGFAKLLHWLRQNPNQRTRYATALEHCDMIASVLCGIKRLDELPRSVCAMGHKWMWNESLGGLPSEEFLVSVDPLFEGIRATVALGKYRKAGVPAGTLSGAWAQQLGLSAGIPVGMGALDAHWDAVAAGILLGDVVNVIGTSTCMIGMSDATTLVPGVCGVVPGSVHPDYTGIEAGLSATGDIFDAIARRAEKSVDQLGERLKGYRAGQTGLLRLTWDNGDRTILVNPSLGGVTLGWNLTHGPEDEFFAAIEGTAFHTRIILDHMQAYGAPVARVINGGGIPRKNELLNQVYANVFNKPVLVPVGDVTGLCAAAFAFLTAGIFTALQDAQQALCPPYKVYEPQAESQPVYEELFGCFKRVYLGLGKKEPYTCDLTTVLLTLRRLAATS
ncbi:MAG TPA: ribulokinase [Terracidiphilus sp.]